MAAIKTLVYFDLEATGLKCSGRPRISELSFVAIDAQDIHILNKKLVEKVKNIQNHEDILQLETLLPRVLNKLTICVYPMASIMPEVSSITGLDNYNLSGQARFEKSTGDLLNAFLSRLPFPVCLVAHNGNLYDFPLLRAELVKVGEELGPNILCVDSYVGIKEILKTNMEMPLAECVKPVETENIEEKEIVESELKAVKSLLEAGEFDKEMDIDRSKSIKSSKLQEKEQSRNINAFEILIEKRKSVQTEHIEEKETVENEMKAVQSLLESGEFDIEMEIDRSKYIQFSTLLEKERSVSINSLEMLIEKSTSEQTPPRNNTEQSRNVKVMKRKQMHRTGVFKYKKKLEFPASQSFSLINLHRQLLGYTPTILHGAEADSLALLRITAVIGDKWLEWANDNCIFFSETKQMWGT
jgi:DNA polymerase III epsilon subunit-like protein